jgi:hypothetical protein
MLLAVARPARWNGIIAGAAQRIAAQDTPERERASDDDSALPHGGDRVLRARREEPTTRPSLERRQRHAVDVHRKEHEPHER